MQEGMDTVPIDAVIGHLKGEDGHLVLAREKEGALTMAEELVRLLHTEGTGRVLVMGEDIDQGVEVRSMAATAEAMGARGGGRDTVLVPTTRERR